MTSDRHYMDMALRLARRGDGRVSPNPMVGAVLVRDGKVIGRGYHHAAGQDHAEVVALKDAGFSAQGADLYVNLEPCCHYGRTPPCSITLMQSGVRCVFMAMVDPNPIVSGRGVACLREGGVEVHIGLLEDRARELNRSFVKWITSGRPFVTLKTAVTVDGHTADREGGSKWITSAESRRRVHQLRARVDGVMVGGGTVKADDPHLLARDVPTVSQPRRIVMAGEDLIPLDSRLVATVSQGPVIVLCPDTTAVTARNTLANSGVTVVALPGADGQVSIDSAMDWLGKAKVTSLLVEGGATLAGRLIMAQVVDRWVVFTAPKLLGDGQALPMVGDIGIRDIGSAKDMSIRSVKRVGPDLMVEYDIKTP